MEQFRQLSMCLASICAACTSGATSIDSTSSTPVDAINVVEHTMKSDLPEMVEIAGGSKLGFERASKFEVTWRLYGQAVQHAGCRPPIGIEVEAEFGVEWKSIRAQKDDPRFGTQLPVTGINSDDIKCFLNWLNRETGGRYRLPTAEQWRWLAYGSVEALFPWGDDPGFGLANISADSRLLFNVDRVGRPTNFTPLLPVGRFSPNAFGLYDTIGNAGEFVDDCYDDQFGASPSSYPSCLIMGAYAAPVSVSPRTGVRQLMLNDGSSDSVGFRIIE